jgi:hypothetical protein
MKNLIQVSLFCLFLILNGCKPKADCSSVINNIKREFEAGNFSRVTIIADSVRKACKDNAALIEKADSLEQIADRIAIDFSLTEEQVAGQIEQRISSFSKEEQYEWEQKGWLEGRLINGEKKYFRRTVSNLFLLKKFYEQKELWFKENAADKDLNIRLSHTEEAYKTSGNENNPVLPQNFRITYSITVKADAVPDGETVRCWMPWPKSNHLRQTNVKLLTTSDPEYIIAQDSALHTTLYMEEKAKSGLPTAFQATFLYQSLAQHFNMSAIKILPYDKDSEMYKQYTSEQLPQINFAENIKHLADSISSGEDNPAAIVRKIYYWFKENIPWTGALEYSIIPDIPQYVVQYKRGDCGMQTFLFMSMLRYKGVPVRWQSGWMIPPGSENLHDWCEVYYEGTGWVPVDVSYDLQNSGVDGIKEYYISGIDAYRLIVNDGVAGDLYPHKNFLRSEPYDFQRGEVEWKGGNLYFDKWDYDMKIDYLK